MFERLSLFICSLTDGSSPTVNQPFVDFKIDPEALAQMLAKYGPWGICVILFTLIVFLYIHMSKKNDKIRKEERLNSDKQRRDLVKALEVKQEQFMALIGKLSRKFNKDDE